MIEKAVSEASESSYEIDQFSPKLFLDGLTLFCESAFSLINEENHLNFNFEEMYN
jgi:hypothetical protein